MTGKTLVVLYRDRALGTIAQDPRGRLRFTYEPDWQSDPDAFPLSLSMPLAAQVHAHDPVHAYLSGLLPDNPLILDRWAKRFQVSPRNPFALIAHVGEDCAGAVQFVAAERVDALRQAKRLQVAWLDERDVGARLRAVRLDHAAWRVPEDSGQFSLAGAQPKTALLFLRGRWGVPSGRTPTTHILKPPTGDFDGHTENEQLCLMLARALGLPAVTSRVQRFAGEVAIVVERYDRVSSADVGARLAQPAAEPVLRIHQEDVCQALGLPPTSKYQNEGGPSPSTVVELLRTHSSNPSEDIDTFVAALAFNWLIAGTDAHAKNYSLLHGAAGALRLAPLYDLASALPYERLDQRRLKLAMKIGGEYRVRDVTARHFEKLAAELRLDPDATLARVRQLAAALAENVEPIRKQARRERLTHPIVGRLCALLAARAQHCLQALG
jgi:serine/threonine-protein kinase HipA